MYEHLCDHLYVRHSLDSVKKIRQEDGPEKVYKVSSFNIQPAVKLAILEMEAPLGGAQWKHFTLKVFPKLLQKGERLAVQEPERNQQMPTD